MTKYEQNQVLYENSKWRYWKESQQAKIKVKGSFPEKTVSIFTDKYNAYSGKHNFICNTGYSKGGISSITLTFENTGVYTMDDLEVICQPMNNIDSQTDKLGKETLTDIQMNTNEITGKISVSKPKALLIAVPYNEGFTAYVDGKETEVKQANTMYMALELAEGDHEIKLEYCTPYLKTGLCLTCIGILCYSWIVFMNRKGKRRNK